MFKMAVKNTPSAQALDEAFIREVLRHVIDPEVGMSRLLYLPLLALHASLLVRLAGTLSGSATLSQSAGIANALALLLFVLTILYSVLRGRHPTTVQAT